jgi:ubiquinone/menaquinone biosynthesis C-methylase UbiE
MNIIKKILNFNCLEIILFVLLIHLLIISFQTKKEGFIDTRTEFVRHVDDDVYDDFYANVYDKILYNNIKNNFEIEHIFTNPSPNNFVLDIGCGTGHHVKLLNDLNIKALGIDNSNYMIHKCKSNFPELNFKKSNSSNIIEFPENTFSHILCFYFTIYYFKDKRQLLENCYHWLQPNGLLVIHLVNVNKFEPIVPNASYFDYENDPIRPTKSGITFDNFNYKASFIQHKNINFNTITLQKPNVIFKEQFIFNNKKKTRINEHKLYMSSQQSILAAAREIGFTLHSQIEMKDIQYNYNYLYILQKSSDY